MGIALMMLECWWSPSCRCRRPLHKQASSYVRPHQITQQTLAAHCGHIEAFIHLNQFARESCVCVRDAKHIEDWNMWRHSCQILIVGHMLEIMLILIRFLLHQPHIRAARQISLIFLSTWILWELEMAVILVKSQVMSWSLLNFTCVEPFLVTCRNVTQPQFYVSSEKARPWNF